jgi:hypothetical protein
MRDRLETPHALLLVVVLTVAVTAAVFGTLGYQIGQSLRGPIVVQVRP